MIDRELFLLELLENVDSMIEDIQYREIIETDLAIVRELAEQLREEVKNLS